MVKITFLAPITPTRQPSARERGLEDAKAKSHAAGVAHERAGHQRWLPRRSRRSHFRKSPDACEDEDYYQPLPIEQSPTSSSVRTGPLDPFMVLPSDLNRHERVMLYTYLDLSSRSYYGSKKDPVICPIRDYGILHIASSSCLLQTYLLMAEVAVQASHITVLSRRASLYSAIRSMISQSESDNDYYVVMQLTWLGAMEGRFERHDLSSKHYNGALRLLDSLGGFDGIHSRDLDHTCGITILWCFLHRHCGFFTEEEKLVAALGRVSFPTGNKLDERLRKYFEPVNCDRQQLGNLYMMSSIMEDEPEGFVDDLRHALPGDGEHLSMSGMTFVIPTCTHRVGAWHGDNPAIKSRATVEFVELLGYASLETREAVRDVMFTRLFDGVEVRIDVPELKTEILKNWRAEKDKVEAVKEVRRETIKLEGA